MDSENKKNPFLEQCYLDGFIRGQKWINAWVNDRDNPNQIDTDISYHTSKQLHKLTIEDRIEVF